MKTAIQQPPLILLLKRAILDPMPQKLILTRLRFRNWLRNQEAHQLLQFGDRSREVSIHDFIFRMKRRLDDRPNSFPLLLFLARGIPDGLIRQPILSSWICVGALKGSGFKQA